MHRKCRQEDRVIVGQIQVTRIQRVNNFTLGKTDTVKLTVLSPSWISHTAIGRLKIRITETKP